VVVGRGADDIVAALHARATTRPADQETLPRAVELLIKV